MHALIDALPRTLTIVVIEHDMDIVLDLADRIVVLDYGRVLEQGTPADIRASAVVRDRYLGEPPAAASSLTRRSAPAMSAALLQVEDIHTYLGDSYIIQGVSLAVPAGKVVALLGRNGAGKTTTLRSIMRMVATAARTRQLRRPRHQRARDLQIARARIAFVQETRAIFPSLTVEENLAIAARPSPLPQTRGGGGWTIARIFDDFPHLARGAATAAHSCPAASSRCWRSRGRWSPTRACSCSTSRARGWRR